MNTAPTRHRISAWSAVSPFGFGRAAFRDGVDRADAPATVLDQQVWSAPAERAQLVPGFDPVSVLGSKGTRSMDRVTGLAVHTVGQLLADPAADRVADGSETALVLGTTTGSAQSTMDFARDSRVGAKPFYVDPGRFPNTTMNCAAGRSAIWHRLKGPNATVAGGRVAGLHALKYGGRLLRAGRATSVLCGGVEECSHARAWLDARGGDPPAHLLGEGCAVFHLHAGTDAEPGAELLGVRINAFGRAEPRETLRRCLRTALRESEVDPGEVRLVAPSGADPRDAESEALAEVLGAEPRVLRIADRLGDAGAAAIPFQLAAVLSVAEPGIALITALDPDGGAGCAVLRTG